MIQTRAPRRRWEARCAPDWDAWSPERMKAIQEEKLSRFLTEQIYPFHPYYRRLFDEEGIDPASIRTVDDLRRIPFTYKEDIAPSREDADSPRRFVIEPGFDAVKLHRPQGWVPDFAAGGPRAGWGSEQEFREMYQPTVTMFTTGRTAEPTPFFFTLHDMARMKEAGRRLASIISSNTSEDSDLRGVAINNFPGVAHLAYWVALTGAEGSAFTMVSTGGGVTMGNELILNIIERVRPTLFMGLPGYTYDLFKRAASEGRDLASIEVVAMGGDRISRGSREKVGALLEEMGAVEPVVTGAYGCTEMKYAWGDCGDEEDQGYHTCPDMEIIEVVDPETGEVLGEGETGELVITNLDARGSAVLRYRTGDILVGGFTTGRCPNCGRTMPRISGNIYRRLETAKEFALSKVKGNLVDLNAFATVMDTNMDVLEWQVEIKKRNDDPDDIDEVWIFVCPTSVGDITGLKERVVEDVRTSLEFRPDYVVVGGYEEVAERPSRGKDIKRVRVADLRPEG